MSTLNKSRGELMLDIDMSIPPTNFKLEVKQDIAKLINKINQAASKPMYTQEETRLFEKVQEQTIESLYVASLLTEALTKI